MENTSCGDKCPFVKQGFCSSYKECPNHVETWWKKADSEVPVKICDCSPKRLILQQQLLQNRFEGVQRSLEQARNEYHELANHLRTLIEMSKRVIQQKGIKNENFSKLDYNDNSIDKL